MNWKTKIYFCGLLAARFLKYTFFFIGFAFIGYCGINTKILASSPQSTIEWLIYLHSSLYLLLLISSIFGFIVSGIASFKIINLIWLGITLGVMVTTFIIANILRVVILEFF